MSIQFNFFSPFDEDKVELINKIKEVGYGVFLDKKNGCNIDWIKKQMETAYFLVLENGELVEGSIDPYVMVTPPEMDGVERYLEWCNNMRNGVVNDLGIAPLETVVLKLDEPEEVVQNTEYSVRTIWLNKDLYYEVQKPYTDLPYTTVVYNFEKHGHLLFFTNLFICKSWGVSGNDIGFLKELWGRWGMEGEFDIDKLLKERTESCYPNSGDVMIEPTVWRKGVEHVLADVNKRNGFYFLFFGAGSSCSKSTLVGLRKSPAVVVLKLYQTPTSTLTVTP